MAQLQLFTFNPFLENTYVLSSGRTAWIIDPGCSNGNERKMLESYLKKNELTPQYIINTHCHIDHVLGNAWAVEKYKAPLYIPAGEEIVLASLSRIGQMYGMSVEESPAPDHLILDGEQLFLEGERWEFISAPGHSPASICLYQAETNTLIAGDVLFLESIGRTDLPGGNHQTLLKSIRERLFPLPDATRVFPGHGPDTTIGHEKVHNPFLRDNAWE
jgi:hydroxyacylglutathione hydrolase